MTEDKGILISNIFYMLAYAFKDMQASGYEYVDKEDFEHIQDLFAEILYRGVSAQLKQGLYREYIERRESMPTLRGKLDINGTIRHKMQNDMLLACEYDVLSENNIFNQIIKTTAVLLFRSADVQSVRRKQLKKILPFFSEISELDPFCIRWDRLKFQRNNKAYRMLIYVCYFVIKGMLVCTKEGKYQFSTFSEKEMSSLYEHFVLEYYKRHFPQYAPNASCISWCLDEENTSDKSFLPGMKTDITLTNRATNKTLIIDTKYYTHMTETVNDKKIIHTANLYQIFAYATNKKLLSGSDVTAMLLYAKVKDEVVPTTDVTHELGVRLKADALDLSVPFEEIKKQLNSFVELLN